MLGTNATTVPPKEVTALILAAGAGTRMKSKKSKVLHRLAGRALLQYPILAALGAGARRVVVVVSPSQRTEVETCLEELRMDGGDATQATFELAVQQRPLGSGDAARAALGQLGGGLVLVLNGDAPLIEARPLIGLLDAFQNGSCDLALLSCALDNPFGYGRVVRDAQHRVSAIREQKDLALAQTEIREVNAGLYCASAEFLSDHLPQLSNNNAAGEFYFTDLIAVAAARRGASAVAADPAALQGVNDRVQLHAMEQLLYERIAARHRQAGVTVGGGACIDDQVYIGPDTTLGTNVALRGRTRIGQDVLIDNGSVITDSTIEDAAWVKPFCVVERSHVGCEAQVGPFAHLRPGAVLGHESKVGNFVEVKQSELKRGAKVNHLSYIGDGVIGEHSNIGAGTIFCNYDGFSKARTVVGNHVFIGSDSQLVAPVIIGDGSFIATGSTVTEDVAPQSLAISRGRQVTKEGYAPKLRERLQANAEAHKSRKL